MAIIVGCKQFDIKTNASILAYSSYFLRKADDILPNYSVSGPGTPNYEARLFSIRPLYA